MKRKKLRTARQFTSLNLLNLSIFNLLSIYEKDTDK